ncbi:MAG: molecular chaperone TorD family protein [Coriobacteriales bacterium]|jgi:TorA maturation chaperone TorD|nr:molecular chaperone TorD family protein [Coriobacteriales bacterium]
MTIPDKALITSVLAEREASYRMLSRLYLKPLSEQDIDELAAVDFVAAAKALEEEGLLSKGFNDMGRALTKRHTGTRQQLATDFTMCFDGVEALEGQVAVPYASVFLSEKALLNQEPRHEVYRLFRSESISLKRGVNLPEDHLSFELEFLAILSQRAGEALAAEDADELVRNLELSRSFINEYILIWFPLFRDRALRILKTRFYRGVLEATEGYLELDLTTIDGLMETARA